MGKIIVVEGHELENLLESLRTPGKRPIYKISVMIDGGLMVKINEGMWTPPLGEELQ